MKVFSNLSNERGWQLSNAQLKEALGVSPTKHWPQQGVKPTLLGNVWVRVLPTDVLDSAFRPRGRKPNGGWKTRALATCPVCLREVNAGKLHQHQKGKACEPTNTDPTEPQGRYIGLDRQTDGELDAVASMGD